MGILVLYCCFFSQFFTLSKLSYLIFVTKYCYCLIYIVAYFTNYNILQDSTLYQHAFKDATCPAMFANPQALAISPLGEIAFATRVNSSSSRPSKIPGILR